MCHHRSVSISRFSLSDSCQEPAEIRQKSVTALLSRCCARCHKLKFMLLPLFPSTRREQKKFPIDNLAEWNHNNNPLGLRSMQVYVLVFDMGNLETFQVISRFVLLKCTGLTDSKFLYQQYCRSIREQILSSFTHRNFSIMVVGNKFDLVVDSPNYSQVS